MGANSMQGWCLLVFFAGFSFFVAGLAYLGLMFAFIGLAAVVGSAVGLYRIKPLEHGGHLPSAKRPISAVTAAGMAEAGAKRA
jgi:hypothetical protein